MGSQVLHGAPHHQRAIDLIAVKDDVADLDLGPFVHFEYNFERRGRNLADLRLHGGELPAALGQVFLQNVAARCTLLGSYCDSTVRPTLRSLKRSRISESRHRFVAVVLDGPDHAALDHHEAHDPAGRARLALHADVVEAARVPQRHEVAVQRLLVVLVALLGEDHGSQGVLRHAPNTLKSDGIHHILARLGGLQTGLRRAGRGRLHSLDLGLGRLRRGFARLWNGFKRIIFRRLRLGGLSLRLVLLRQKGKRAQHGRRNDAQASEPGKCHLIRVPFHFCASLPPPSPRAFLHPPFFPPPAFNPPKGSSAGKSSEGFAKPPGGSRPAQS